MVQVANEEPKRRIEGAESPWWIAALYGGVAILIVVGVLLNRKPDGFAQWSTLLGVIATLSIFSILYKENPVFRFMEHIFIGLATGVTIVILWLQFLYPNWLVPMLPPTLIRDGQGHWWLVFALLLASLFFTVYIPKLSWMNRLGIGILMGWTAGYAWKGFRNMVAPQIIKSFKAPVTVYQPDGMPVGANNFHFGGLWWHPWALVFIVTLLCVLAYFFFSVEHRARWIRQPANAGRYLLMITLGAIFGTTVMGRFSLLIERLDFLQRSFVGWGHQLFR